MPSVGLRAYGNEYYDGYIQAKVRLMDVSPDVRWSSSAAEDLIAVLKERNPEKFLLSDEKILKDCVDFAVEKAQTWKYRNKMIKPWW